MLEEMPPFPERESSILAKLKKKRPDKVSVLLEPKAPGRASFTETNKPEQSVSSVSISTTSDNIQNHVWFLLMIGNSLDALNNSLSELFMVTGTLGYVHTN